MADLDLGIVVAIQNALARGQSIEAAMKSLINAGYSQQEVQEAAREAQFGIKQLQQAQTFQITPKPKPAKEPVLKSKKIIISIIVLGIIILSIIVYFIIKLF